VIQQNLQISAGQLTQPQQIAMIRPWPAMKPDQRLVALAKETVENLVAGFVDDKFSFFHYRLPQLGQVYRHFNCGSRAPKSNLRVSLLQVIIGEQKFDSYFEVRHETGKFLE